MALTSRQDRILAMVRTDASATVPDLVRTLQVSEATVRRELHALAEAGLVKRVRGGAVERQPGLVLPPPADRERESRDEKRRIAQVAAQRVCNGSTVILDAGSTTKQMVPFLLNHRNLTVITRDLRIATLLTNQPQIQLIMLGGTVVAGTEATAGGHTLVMLRQFYADQVFLGAYGISTGGLTTANAEEALVKAEMLQRSEQTVVLADASKIGRLSGAHVAPLDQVSVIITDNRVTAQSAAALTLSGPEVVRV